VSTTLGQLNLNFSKHLALLSPDEIYGAAESALLSTLKEDRRIERKPPGIQIPYLATYFSMWANTPPEGGLIAVGVEDDGSHSGCQDLSNDRLNDLEKAPFRSCPDARIDSKRVEVSLRDGAQGFILLFRVRYREDKVVRTNAGEAFIRHGTRDTNSRMLK
jgi:ATP-dependent DNA helicase RecG